MSLSVNIQKISKSFDEVKALSEVSFDVKPNELFGLIGPDGAGKTTLFRIIASLLKPDSGNASMDNFDTYKDYKAIRKMIGYMPGQFSLYYDLSVIENLQFYATIFKTTIQKNYDLIKEIYSQIEPFKDRRAGNLSGGMKQKLALSCALIHRPKVLLLDEPTTGVDAVSRMEFWQLLKKLQKKDITIIVSTPYMDEAGLCDQVALIQNGKILDVNKPGLIEESYPYPLFEVKSSQMFDLGNDLKNFQGAISAHRFGDSIHFCIDNKDIKKEDISMFLNEKKHKNIKVGRIKASIEDNFLLMGMEL